MEYYERCNGGLNELGLPKFVKDATLSKSELFEAKRIHNALYHRAYNKLRRTKDAEKTYAQEYYAANKDKVRGWNLKYRKNHPEKFNEYKKRTYEKYKDSYKIRAKDYYYKHRESILKRRAELRQLEKKHLCCSHSAELNLWSDNNHWKGNNRSRQFQRKAFRLCIKNLSR